MSAACLLAWVLAIGSGGAAMLALSRPRQPGRWMAAIGYGSVLGMLLAGGLAAIAARGDTGAAWLRIAPWQALLGVVAGAVVLWRQRGARWRPSTPGPEKVDYWKNILVALALASLVWRGSLLASEVLLRPTYPWDAWDAWAVKAKTWFLLGHYAPFVVVGDWLRGAGAELYSGPAWAYPATLAWVQIDFASAAGAWTEPLVNLPWVVLWVGLLCGHYGQWRALGLGRPQAAIGMYALGSLPLLATHVALAGYADLWIATLFGFAMLAWLRWQEQRSIDQLVVAVLCAALLPLIKLEGMVWCVCLLAAIAFGVIPRRWRWRAAALASALVVLLVVVGEASVLFAAIGWVRSGSRVIDVPVIGRLALAWHGDAALGLVHSLFTQSNWNLLWWLALPVVVWRWRVLRASDALGLFSLLLLVCLGLLAFLFVFTDAAEWAESYTAVNRLVMHVTPGVVSLLALLLREPVPVPANDRVPGSAALPDPA